MIKLTEEIEIININSESIKLDQFLKWVGEADTGGTAKFLIKEGIIEVNGEKVQERGKKLIDGDIIEILETNKKYKLKVEL